MEGTPKFIAGSLALDFHNTASWDADKPIADNLLDSYDDVLAWAVEAGAIDRKPADSLLRTAEADPAAGAAAFERIIELRQILHDVFTPLGEGEDVTHEGLAALNERLAHIPMTLTSAWEGFTWDWSGHPDDLTSVAWPVVWSAAELLRSPDVDRVGGCELEGCGWLFVDRSRRHNRKWCQMEVCGNRAKARRHYHRASKR